MRLLIIIIVTIVLCGSVIFINSIYRLFPGPGIRNPWVEDLAYYQSTLEHKHIDLYHKISKEDFNKEIQRLKRVSSKNSDMKIIIDLMRLTRKIGDGHTAVYIQNKALHFYPLEFSKIEGKWRVIKVGKDHKDLLGMEFVNIEGQSMENIALKVSEVAQFVENKQSEIVRTAQNMNIAELLFGLLITKNPLKATFTFRNDVNEMQEATLNAVNREKYEKMDFEVISIQVPEISKPKNPKHDMLWFSPIDGTKGIYIKLGAYPSPGDMEAFGRKVLRYINDHSIEKMVIDLRNNGGGDFFVGLTLANYLNLADPIDWKSGVYVLTDKVTFSAGSCNAAQFRQILNAKIVGEPTGSNPIGYQDMSEFVLPYSALTITFSKRLFRLQQNHTEGVQPDELIQYDWDNFSNGNDIMLRWVIDDMK